MRIVCGLLFLSISVTFAVQIQSYQGGYFNRDSISTSLAKPSWYEINCGHVCADIEECSNFVAPPSHESCHSVSKTAGLVKTSKMSQKAARLFFKQPFQTVPHFLIIHSNGVLEDFSLDNGESPKITTYGKFLGSLSQPCGLLLEREMKLVMRSAGKANVYEWHFDERNPSKVEYNPRDTRLNRINALCATSPKTGKVALYSGPAQVNSIFLYQGGRAKVVGVNHQRRAGCAAFHPINDDILYVIGGRHDGALKHSFSYQFSTGEHQDIRPLEKPRDNHRCIGFINRNGKPAILIVGGREHEDPTKVEPTDTVLEYDIESNQYKDAPKLINKRSSMALTKKDGYFYVFGGKNDNGDAKPHIYKVATSLQEDWKKIGDMGSNDYDFSVVSYN